MSTARPSTGSPPPWSMMAAAGFFAALGGALAAAGWGALFWTERIPSVLTATVRSVAWFVAGSASVISVIGLIAAACQRGRVRGRGLAGIGVLVSALSLLTVSGLPLLREALHPAGLVTPSTKPTPGHDPVTPPVDPPAHAVAPPADPVGTTPEVEKDRPPDPQPTPDPPAADPPRVIAPDPPTQDPPQVTSTADPNPTPDPAPDSTPPTEAAALPAIFEAERTQGWLPVRAARVDEIERTRDLAWVAHGGSAEIPDPQGARDARALIDGDARTPLALPGGVKLLLGFPQSAVARIDRLVLWPDATAAPSTWPAEVQVYHRADASPAGNYAFLGKLRLGTTPAPHVYELPAPIETRWLMFVAGAARRGGAATLGDLAVLEAGAVGTPSMLDEGVNLLCERSGGCVLGLWLDGGAEAGALGRLIDGAAATAWTAPAGKGVPALVFAFRHNLAARLARLRIEPDPQAPAAAWVKEVRVLTATDSPFGPFRDRGVQRATAAPAPLVVELEGESARFVRLEILSTHGRAAARLGEVRAFELPGPAASSVLVRAAEAGGGAVSERENELIAELEAQQPRPEVEPNEAAASATAAPLALWLRGTLAGAADTDTYAVTLAGEAIDTLTVDLAAFPFVRATAVLFDAAGKEVARREPGGNTARQVRFSWPVRAGTYFVRLTQSPARVALVFDCSNSMRGRFGDLEAALRAYVADVTPNERLALVKFSDQVWVLADFAGDPAALAAALAGQIKDSGGTAIYDALAAAFGLFEKTPGDAASQVAILMTDGLSEHDKQVPYPRFWPMLERAPVVVYTIGLGQNLHAPAERLGCSPSRLLENIACARSGKYFHAPESDVLRGLYAQIARELKQDFHYYLRFTAGGTGKGTLETQTLGQAVEQTASGGNRQVEVILDASYSMLEPIGGRRKIEVAKEALGKIVRGLAAGTSVALRVYGNRVAPREPGFDRDSELMIPLSPLKPVEFIRRVDGIECKGSTPIAWSLARVPEDLKAADVRRATVILLSDGEETGGGDPVREARNLIAGGYDLQIHVIGFDVGADSLAARQLREVADVGGGTYYDAANADELARALKGVFDVRGYRLETDKGSPVRAGTFGDRVELPAGNYRIVVEVDGRTVRTPLEIRPGQTVRATFSPADGTLTLSGR